MKNSLTIHYFDNREFIFLFFFFFFFLKDDFSQKLSNFFFRITWAIVALKIEIFTHKTRWVYDFLLSPFHWIWIQQNILHFFAHSLSNVRYSPINYSLPSTSKVNLNISNIPSGIDKFFKLYFLSKICFIRRIDSAILSRISPCIVIRQRHEFRYVLKQTKLWEMERDPA